MLCFIVSSAYTISFILSNGAFSYPGLTSIYFLTVHLIIPGLNETAVKLPMSIMLEISDAIKAQLGKQLIFIFALCYDWILALVFLGLEMSWGSPGKE